MEDTEATRKTWPGAPPSLVLLDESNEKALDCFNLSELDYINGASTRARLPEGDYLVRVCLANKSGEAGLTTTPEVRSALTLPPGVQLAVPQLATEQHAYPTLSILYKALLWLRPTPTRASDHWLAYFYQLAQSKPGKNCQKCSTHPGPLSAP